MEVTQVVMKARFKANSQHPNIKVTYCNPKSGTIGAIYLDNSDTNVKESMVLQWKNWSQIFLESIFLFLLMIHFDSTWHVVIKIVWKQMWQYWILKRHKIETFGREYCLNFTTGCENACCKRVLYQKGIIPNQTILVL